MVKEKYYLKVRDGKDYHLEEVKKNIYEIERYYRKNKSNPSLKRIIFKVKRIENNTYLPHIGVLYAYDENLNNQDDKDIEIVPHGNSKASYNQRPYIRTAQKTLNRERELLDTGKSVQEVYRTVLEESGGPMRCSSQSLEPRDTRQIYTIKAKRKRLQAKQGDDAVDDELTNVIRRIASLQVVQSIIINKKCYFYFLSTDRQLNDIEKFCCTQNEVSVFGIDTTFNLCDMWVTDSSYRNKRIIGNVSGEHPVFLGPALFHFTKDEKTFTRFALELQAEHPPIRNLKKIGLDMEDAIFNGVKVMFPNVEQLYCVRHLQQRDEIKISKMLEGKNVSEKEKHRAKREIVIDVYGQRIGDCYEYGLCEAKDETEFIAKLKEKEKRWESLCKGYFSWFWKNRKDFFVSSVIQSAREGTDLKGLFYQNDIEALHFVEKINQGFIKKTTEDAIKNLESIIQQQNDEEIRALYGAGTYR